jgi:hypothetical protein
MSDIRYRVDADTKPFRSKMDGLKKTAKDAGDKVVAQFRSMGAVIAGVFSAQAAKGLATWADGLLTVADSAGVSVEFLQRWRRVHLESGVDMAKSSRGLEVFSRKIGEAQRGEGVFLKTLDSVGISLRDKEGKLKTVEQLLYEYSDAIKNAKSEQEALALTTKALGEEGAQMAAKLRQGGDQVRRDIEATTAARREELKVLAEVNAQMELAGDTSKVLAARIFSFLGNRLPTSGLSRLLGSLFGGAGIKDAFKSMFTVLTFDDSAAREAAREKQRIEEAATHAIKMQAQKVEELKQKKRELAALDKARSELLSAQLAKEAATLAELYAQLQVKQAGANAAAGAAVRDRFGLTVGEAANPANRFMAQYGLTAAGQQNVATARRIEHLEEWARWARLNRGAPGAYEDEMAAMKEADRLRGGLEALTDAERNPFAAIEEQLASIDAEAKNFHKVLADFGMKLRAN